MPTPPGPDPDHGAGPGHPGGLGCCGGRGPGSRYAAPPLELDDWHTIHQLEQTAAATAGPTHWPSLDEEDLAAALEDLRVWVDQLVDRFALDVRTVPPCWDRHNAMVEALAALRDYERGCYTDTAPPSGGVDFIRALREITLYLRDTGAQTQCSVREHRPDLTRQ